MNIRNFSWGVIGLGRMGEMKHKIGKLIGRIYDPILHEDLPFPSGSSQPEEYY